MAWRTDKAHLRENLDALKQHNTGKTLNQREIMIFLPDLLDAIFSILMDNSLTEYDEAILSALSTLIVLIANERFKHFQAVLETYIFEHFSHTQAACRLVSLITKRIKTRISMPPKIQMGSDQSDVNDRFYGNTLKQML